MCYCKNWDISWISAKVPSPPAPLAAYPSVIVSLGESHGCMNCFFNYCCRVSSHTPVGRDRWQLHLLEPKGYLYDLQNERSNLRAVSSSGLVTSNLNSRTRNLEELPFILLGHAPTICQNKYESMRCLGGIQLNGISQLQEVLSRGLSLGDQELIQAW